MLPYFHLFDQGGEDPPIEFMTKLASEEAVLLDPYHSSILMLFEHSRR